MPQLTNPATGRTRSVSEAQASWYRKRGWVDPGDVDLMADAGIRGATAGASVRTSLERGADESERDYFLASAGYNPDPPESIESTDI